jgi:hypothetical protein
MKAMLRGWPMALAFAMVCLAFFYAGEAVGRMPYELADPGRPRWIPIARVLVFGTSCWFAMGWLREAIRRASHPMSVDRGAAT